VPHGLIIRLIIQTIRWDRSGAVWIDEASNVSRPGPSGADQIDAEHQATELASGHGGCWPLPHLAVPLLVGHRVAVDGCAAGGPAWRCRRVRPALPPSRVAAAPGACGCRCPPAASSVRGSGPSLSAGCPGPGAEPSRCPRNRTPQPPVADHPGTPADCSSGHRRRLRKLPGCPRCLRNCGHLAMPSRWLEGGRRAAVRSAADLDTVSVRGPPLRPESRLVSGRPLSARDPAAVGGCRLLPEPVAYSAAAGGVPPLPGGVGELAAEPLAELGAYVGHGRPLQG
jgi:hypothetical protein